MAEMTKVLVVRAFYGVDGKVLPAGSIAELEKRFARNMVAFGRAAPATAQDIAAAEMKPEPPKQHSAAAKKE